MLIERLQKYQHYRQVKLINILQLKKFYHLIKVELTFSPLGKAIEK